MKYVRQSGKQRYHCKDCNRQFLESDESKGYSDACFRKKLTFTLKLGFGRPDPLLLAVPYELL